MAEKLRAGELGRRVKATRTRLGITQQDLALTACTGLRFIIELEHGKPTCQIQKTLDVLHTLGIRVTLDGPTGR